MFYRRFFLCLTSYLRGRLQSFHDHRYVIFPLASYFLFPLLFILLCCEIRSLVPSLSSLVLFMFMSLCPAPFYSPPRRAQFLPSVSQIKLVIGVRCGTVVQISYFKAPTSQTTLCCALLRSRCEHKPLEAWAG